MVTTLCGIAVIQLYLYIYIIHNICGNIVNNNDELQWTNEPTCFFIKIYLSYFILERVDVGCVWEVSWRRGQTATYWPKVLLTIAALLSHLSLAAQPGVTEGPSLLSGAGSHSADILSSTETDNWLKPSVAPGYIFVWRPPASCGRTLLPPSPNSTTSAGQVDIPISSTGCTCFAVLPLIYTGTSLDWRLGRGSICYTYPINCLRYKVNFLLN